MSICQYCHKEIAWTKNAAGKAIPVNADGTPHHRTCKAFHKAKAIQARRDREARAAYGPARAAGDFPENPGQMHFAF